MRLPQRLLIVSTFVLFSTTLLVSWPAATQLPAAGKPSPVDGFWLASLTVQGQTLRLQLTVKSDQAGRLSCIAESLDQGGFNFPCSSVVFSGSDFSFDVGLVRGRWSGQLSRDEKFLDGTWIQGDAIPLRFAKQPGPEKPTGKPPAIDAALPQVAVADMQTVLARDLEKTLKGGILAPETNVGVTIGIVRKGERRIFTFGNAKTDSIFEIGSITKTFTGLLLAEMVGKQMVRLDTPVRELLPSGTVAKPPGDEITLLDLVTQHSGLPRMPDNFRFADPNARYLPADLYRFMSRQGVAKPVGAGFLYSNLGLGLLGQALANRANTTYSKLVKQMVLDPLGMTDTGVELSSGQERRFIQGHSGVRPFADVRPSDIDALAGAGALRSTADDMLTYLEANLHPEKAGALSSAIVLSHDLRADADPGMRIAFGWLYFKNIGDYWHDGGTPGYSSYCFFNPTEDYAAIVLTNSAIAGNGSFVDQLGQHISQRLAGLPAISLE